jgi:Regulator of Chromosome Condensation (RCC1) repeat protein
MPSLLKHVHRWVPVAALAFVLGLVAVPVPAHAETEGVPVSAWQGGEVVGWGRQWEHQTEIPQALAGKTVIAVAAGTLHSVALTSDGKVTAWGSNTSDQTDIPPGLDDKTVTAIAANAQNSLALTSDGKVTAWGWPGDGVPDVPDVLDNKTVTAIAAGKGFALALTSDGRVTAWGDDEFGQTDVPHTLDNKTVTAIAAGHDHALALTSDGKVTVWGWPGDEEGRTDVPDTLTDKRVTAIAVGGDQSLALTSDGKVTAWGPGTDGENVVPDELTGRTVTAIAAGYSHSMVLTSEGKVVAWGRDVDGETDVSAIPSGKVVTAIAAGGYHGLAITTDFRAEGRPVVSGDPIVGGAMSATPSRYTATPQKVSYQWFADGAPIIGATAATLRPAGAQIGKRITVQVTAILTGHDSVVTTSDPSGPVTTPAAGTAPTVQLRVDHTSLRRGQPATLSWESTGATSVTASSGWTGPRTTSGTLKVAPTALGTTTYVLTASNAAGTSTAQVQVTVTRPAARLKVTAAKGRHRAGAPVKITVRGLEAGEKYTIRIGRKKVATGTAKTARPLVRTIRLPKAGGRATVRVTGDQTDRTGTIKIRVTRG